MVSSRPLLVVQMGYPPAVLQESIGDQAAWFAQALGPSCPVRVVRPFLGETLPAAHELSAVVISGSWSMVTDHEPWSDATGAWVRMLMDNRVPLLGICYGHQLMSWALGGEVGYHPEGPEIGQKTVWCAPRPGTDPLLGSFPESFDAFLTHEQSVLAPPPGAEVLGSSAHDSHQIIRYSPEALSVQFHPEFSGQIMREIIRYRANKHAMPAQQQAELETGISQTPWSAQILQRFATHYARGQADNAVAG